VRSVEELPPGHSVGSKDGKKRKKKKKGESNDIPPKNLTAARMTEKGKEGKSILEGSARSRKVGGQKVIIKRSRESKDPNPTPACSENVLHCRKKGMKICAKAVGKKTRRPVNLRKLNVAG